MSISLATLSPEDRAAITELAATLNAEALAAMQADRDEWRLRYQRKKAQDDLLDEVLRNGVLEIDVIRLTDARQVVTGSRFTTLFALLEDGNWRALCPKCEEVDCVGGGTSRCSQQACERATERLNETYATWAKMGDV